jgi:hypothetical protein
MQTISAIGLDIAKSVFQVHGVNADGLVVGVRSRRTSFAPWRVCVLGCLVTTTND